LVVKIEKLLDGRIKMSQPYLIDQTLKVLGFNERTIFKRTPAVENKILHPDADWEELDAKREYQRVIGQ